MAEAAGRWRSSLGQAIGTAWAKPWGRSAGSMATMVRARIGTRIVLYDRSHAEPAAARGGVDATLVERHDVSGRPRIPASRINEGLWPGHGPPAPAVPLRPFYHPGLALSAPPVHLPYTWSRLLAWPRNRHVCRHGDACPPRCRATRVFSPPQVWPGGGQTPARLTGHDA